MARTETARIMTPAQTRAEARIEVKAVQAETLRYLVYDRGIAQGAIAAFVGCDASRISRVMSPAEGDVLSCENQLMLARLAASFDCYHIADQHGDGRRVMQPSDSRTNGCTTDEVVSGVEALGRASRKFESGRYRMAEEMFSEVIAAGQRGLAECRLKLSAMRGGILGGRMQSAGESRTAAH